LLELRRSHIAEYLRYFQEHRDLARASLARIIFPIRKFYKFLNLGDKVPDDPTLTMSSPKVPRRLARSLSQNQIEQLLTSASTPRDMAVLELFYAAGIRRAELRALDCEDVHFDVDGKGGTALIRHGKGDKERVTLFGQYAARALRSYLNGRTSGLLILAELRTQKSPMILPNRPNVPRRLGIKSIERIVRKAARNAGLGDVRPHQLRHSFATHLLNGGADLIYIAQLLGHASVVPTQQYLHVATAELIRTHAKFHPRGDNGDQVKTHN
jgi:site-specific recombinase XerD